MDECTKHCFLAFFFKLNTGQSNYSRIRFKFFFFNKQLNCWINIQQNGVKRTWCVYTEIRPFAPMRSLILISFHWFDSPRPVKYV